MNPNDPFYSDQTTSHPQFGQTPPPPPFPNNQPPYPQNWQNYPQPGQFSPPQKLTLKQKFRAMSGWKKFGTIGCSTLIGAILLCSLCAAWGSTLPKQPVTSQPVVASAPTHQTVPATPTLDDQSVLATIEAEMPTPTPVPPTPTPTPVPVVQAPVQPSSGGGGNQPSGGGSQQPAPPPTHTGVYGNPWGYDFTPGTVITNPVSDFCNGVYFSCIASFANGAGYVEECSDGLYSKSGGRSGSCSKHGGDKATLYQH